jgi:hypothetical protein
MKVKTLRKDGHQKQHADYTEFEINLKRFGGILQTEVAAFRRTVFETLQIHYKLT